MISRSHPVCNELKLIVSNIYIGVSMTKEALLQVAKTWCDTVGRSKIEKASLNTDDISREIYSYIHLDGNNIIPSSEQGKRDLAIVMEIYQTLPHHTRNWVAFRIRPEPMMEDTESEVLEKVYTICQKYLSTRIKNSDRIASMESS